MELKALIISRSGSNYLALVYTDRIVGLGAEPSMGSVGDSFDNALTEAVNGLYTTALMRQREPWGHPRADRARPTRKAWCWEQPATPRRTRHAHPEVEHTYYAGLE